MKRALLTGVTGYIGGSVAERLRQEGLEMVGLVRTRADAERVSARGIIPVVGSLEDSKLLARVAQEVDLVINTADSDHRGTVEALVGALRHTGKTLIHTSGSSVVANEGDGEPSEQIYEDTTPFTPVPAKARRVAIDRFVLSAASEGIRSIVLCPTLIYGRGLGLKRDSIQVPALIRESVRRGAGVYVGRGLNAWSNVHIADVAELYKLVIEKAEPGSFFFVENGEATFKDVAVAISQMLGFDGRTLSLPVEEAVGLLGEEMVRYALASNSRVRSTQARQLGWSPKHTSLLKEIESGSYREDFR